MPAAAGASAAGPSAAVPAAEPSRPSARPRRAVPPPPTPARAARGRLYRLTHPRIVFEIIDELRKVTWPSRAETRSLSIVVLIVAISVGILLGTADFAFSRIMENILIP